MTGFSNVKSGLIHFWQHITGVIDADLEQALKLLEPSINAVTAVIKKDGLAAVESAAIGATTAAAASISKGENGSQAGQAALEAVKAAGASVSVTFGTDVLHALATAAVTQAQTAPPPPVDEAPVEGTTVEAIAKAGE